MTEEKPSIKTSKRVLFGLSAIPDQLTYQAFTILVFTFYFAVVGLPVLFVMAAYIVWGIWNALNDPILGALSDRTKFRKRLGRRKLYLIISIIPLSLIMILLFSVPIGTPSLIQFIYFLVIILTFELVYTMWSVNVNSVFPEQFPTEEERAKTNIFVKVFTIIAVICASIIPTIIISPLVPTEANPTQSTRIQFQMMYITAGFVLAIIIFIAALIFIIKGVEEKEQDTAAFENRPSFKDSLKFTLRNKTFLKFTLANMCIWYCFTTLLTALPLYATWVLGIKEQTWLIGLALALALIIAAFVLPLHMKIGQKIGVRNGLILTLGLWICLLFPFVLLNDDPTMRIIGIIVIAIQGLALGGALFYVDINIGNVIDADEVEFGIKRSASYYGVNAFVHRFSQIFSIITIALIFQGTGWSSYEPTATSDITIIGLKLIMFLFPAIALFIAILFLRSFELHGEKLKEVKAKLAQMHSER